MPLSGGETKPRSTLKLLKKKKDRNQGTGGKTPAEKEGGKSEGGLSGPSHIRRTENQKKQIGLRKEGKFLNSVKKKLNESGGEGRNTSLKEGGSSGVTYGTRKVLSGQGPCFVHTKPRQKKTEGIGMADGRNKYTGRIRTTQT